MKPGTVNLQIKTSWPYEPDGSDQTILAERNVPLSRAIELVEVLLDEWRAAAKADEVEVGS